MRAKAFAVAVGITFWFVGSSVRAEVVELLSLERIALEHHALLRAGAARERAAWAEVRQTASAYHPRVGMAADGTAAPGSRLIAIPGSDYLVQGARTIDKHGAFQPQIRAGASVTVAANLYDFGRTSAAVAASRAQHAAVEGAQVLTRTEVVIGIRSAYLAWLSAFELHKLAVAANIDAAARAERVQALIGEGARPHGDLVPVQTDSVLAELELKRARGQLKAAQLILEQASGVQLSDTAEPDPKVLEAQPEPKSTQRAHPSTFSLKQQRSALEATARMHRRERLPILATSLGLGVGARFQDTNGSLKTYLFPTFIAGLSLTVPLWDGGAAKSAADAAEARMEELSVQLESSERAAKQDRERALTDAENAQELEETASRLIELCRARVRDTESGYELGAMQFEQVHQARASLRHAETEMIQARIARAEAVLRIKPVE